MCKILKPVITGVRQFSRNFFARYFLLTGRLTTVTVTDGRDTHTAE